jgi:methanogenic corrinoid protein MtbC1
LGTIASDIHDLGKNLFAILARSNGFKVIDLGVDVPPAHFLNKALQIKPDLIGISCLLTIALPELKEAVKLLHIELPQSPVIIGGTCMDEQICHHVQADYWVRDAIQGLQTCQQILQMKDHKT